MADIPPETVRYPTIRHPGQNAPLKSQKDRRLAPEAKVDPGKTDGREGKCEFQRGFLEGGEAA